MVNGDELLNAVKNLNEEGKLSPEATNTLVLASLGDVLTVVREIKNDNIDIKKSVTILVQKQGTNSSEIAILRKRSWMADGFTAVLAAVGIFLGGRQ